MSGKESSNFFNLNTDTDSEEEEEEEDKQDQIRQSAQKWDWTAEKNRDKFFNQPLADTNLKRSISSSNENKNDLKRIKNTDWSCPTAENRPFIEKINDGSKLFYNLNGHRASVNRIHWSRCLNNKNMLLSSSIDW